MPDEERRDEAVVHLLAQHKADLAKQFPGTSEELRRRFIVVFFALLQQRLGAITTTEWGEA